MDDLTDFLLEYNHPFLNIHALTTTRPRSTFPISFFQHQSFNIQEGVRLFVALELFQLVTMECHPSSHVWLERYRCYLVHMAGWIILCPVLVLLEKPCMELGLLNQDLHLSISSFFPCFLCLPWTFLMQSFPSYVSGLCTLAKSRTLVQHACFHWPIQTHWNQATETDLMICPMFVQFGMAKFLPRTPTVQK